jgi:two-component system response regulator RegX3
VTFVLVVEDEDSFSDALSYMLRKEGFEVAVSRLAPCCSTSCSRDQLAPKCAGACANGRNVPVIMLTARDTGVDRAVRLGLGADD